jgi:hypothetical protein
MTALIAYPASAVADSFTLPESVTHLSTNAFNSAQNLKYVTLNDKITSTRGSFRYCTSLVTIYLGSSVNEFGATHLEDCKSLIEINVHPDNETFASVDGNLYSKDKTVLLLYAMGKNDSSFTVPSTVTGICKYAFGYTSLGSIYIHSDVSFVDSSAFAFAKNRFLKIYCEAAEKPEGWNSNWNPSQYTVYWGQIIN